MAAGLLWCARSTGEVSIVSPLHEACLISWMVSPTTLAVAIAVAVALTLTLAVTIAVAVALTAAIFRRTTPQ